MNTGWTGGPCIGRRGFEEHAREIRALADSSTPSPRCGQFGLACQHAPQVPDSLDLRTTWKVLRMMLSKKLTALFRKNFEQFADSVSAEVRGP